MFTRVYSVPHLNTFQDDIPEGTPIRHQGPDGPKWSPGALALPPAPGLGGKEQQPGQSVTWLSRGPRWSLPRWANGTLSRAKEAVEKLVPCLGWKVVTRVAAGGTV